MSYGILFGTMSEVETTPEKIDDGKPNIVGGAIATLAGTIMTAREFLITESPDLSTFDTIMTKGSWLALAGGGIYFMKRGLDRFRQSQNAEAEPTRDLE